MGYKAATNELAEPPLPNLADVYAKIDALNLLDENDVLAVKQNRLNSVKYALNNPERIDYGTWAYIVAQLRFDDIPSLIKLTKALLPGSDCWFNDDRVLFFKIGDTVCEINTLASCVDVLVHTGPIYPIEKPKLFNLQVEQGTSIPRELPLAQAYFDLADSDDDALKHEIIHALKSIGGKVEWVHKRLGHAVYEEELQLDATFYVRELKKAYKRYGDALDIYNLSKTENLKALENAARAKSVLEGLFPEDLIRYGYDWYGKKGKSWLYYDAFVESFTPDS